jgi:hypothetical protein
MVDAIGGPHGRWVLFGGRLVRNLQQVKNSAWDCDELLWLSMFPSACRTGAGDVVGWTWEVKRPGWEAVRREDPLDG